MRLQEGLGENNPRSSCMFDIEWKKGNNIAILNAIQDLKRLVNERNLSLTEAKNLQFYKFLLGATKQKLDVTSKCPNWTIAMKD